MIERRTVWSELLQDERTVFVWLPPGYHDSDSRHPVLYMQDGQNVFGESDDEQPRWNIDATAEALVEEGAIEAPIIVGIANSEWRDDEYTPWFDEEEGGGGWADHYLEFLLNGVKAMVDETYRVRPFREDTAIGGSSLGGLLSLYAAMRHPELFGNVVAMSPTIAWADGLILDVAREWEVEPENFRIWLDMGFHELEPEEEEEGEPDPLDDAHDLRDVLEEKGFVEGDNLAFVTDPWGFHHEDSWGARMRGVLEFLFGE